MKNIIAVFGGAFNPPTIAHINLAKQILNSIKNTEKVVFVPVSTKYNKNGLASDEDRYNMLKCICNTEYGLEVSNVELDSPRQLYTIETLRTFKKEYPDKEIYFVLGTDNLKEIEKWHTADKLLEEFKIIVLERDNDIMEDIIENNAFLKQHKLSFIKLDNIKRVNLSSSYIREQIKLKKTINSLIPEQIKDKAKEIYK